MANVPPTHVPLKGSTRSFSPATNLLGPAPGGGTLKVTIVVRRRLDGPKLPDLASYGSGESWRPRMSSAEFASKYGATPDDLQKVECFVRSNGMTVVETNAARRSVVVSGMVEQMNKAFAVDLGIYRRTVSRSGRGHSSSEEYRGRTGEIHVPAELSEIVVGVFGLDNRRITKQNGSDPPNTHAIDIREITKLYRFPENSAAGQTIAILSVGGYLRSDIDQYIATLGPGFSSPTITDVSVDADNDGTAELETTQDICIAAAAAPGAAIAVYFTQSNSQGWIELVQRIAHPNPGDPDCSVLSLSVYVSDGDDAGRLAGEGLTVAWVNALSAAFRDAAIQGVTVCVASGDTGTGSNLGDGKAHVQYPASDPWVLSVGGTTVGNIEGVTFSEYVWNDTRSDGIALATGGGISDHFSLPDYQMAAGVPKSLNEGHIGRGVPDVAANASPNSGYPIIVGGAPAITNGTSAAAPLWAALIARINAALGTRVGFINPIIYKAGSAAFRDITPVPVAAHNGLNGVAGYPARTGWDACTGWGSPNGAALLAALTPTG